MGWDVLDLYRTPAVYSLHEGTNFIYQRLLVMSKYAAVCSEEDPESLQGGIGRLSERTRTRQMEKCRRVFFDKQKSKGEVFLNVRH